MVRAGKPSRRKKRPTPTPTPGPAPRGLRGNRVVYVLSDSTGNLARHMLTAFLTQFPRDAFDLRFHNFMQSKANVNAVFVDIRAAATPGLVVHAVMSGELKDAIT